MRIRLTALLTIPLSGLAMAQEPAAPAAQDAQSWVTDWEQAKKQAAEQKKHLLVDFTGSDWCSWCIKLKKEVFDFAEFSDEASKHFVFVELDYPRDTSGMSEELLAQNERLKDEFGIEGYPTIFLTDASGRPYAQTGYQAGGPVKYVEHLAELKADGAKLADLAAKAEEAKGLDKAKALDAALEAVPEDLHRFYAAWMEQVVALDAKNEAGLKEKYEPKLKAIALLPKKQALMNTLNEKLQARDFDAALAAIRSFRSDNADAVTPALSHELFFYEAIVLDSSGKTAEAITALESAKQADPESPMNPRVDAAIAAMKKKLDGGN